MNKSRYQQIEAALRQWAALEDCGCLTTECDGTCLPAISRAALALPPTAEPAETAGEDGGWMPIDENTPHGEHVLVLHEGRPRQSMFFKVSHVPIYGWLNLFCDVEDVSTLRPQPTKWQPLPKPPKDSP